MTDPVVGSGHRRHRPRIRCAAGTGERIAQAAVGVLVAAFALSPSTAPTAAVVAGIAAAVLLVGAWRGWCPGSLAARWAGRAR
ncbi:DUF2892 domain-containing protein [Agrococcus sp. SL85]|uniref:YgaP-like transmembrane domain n=1 Tax=Agrococcus sp. SL85 TaxID=2995141 RepID=UPI00226D1A6D|nr:YgaP-like transmembrane domain [Agrococcus sp. SL85]WAC66039.1 DUF2892 domain-containing protein [Agrococcus sp. SL85]